MMFNYLPGAMHKGLQASGGNFIVLYLFKLLIVLALVLAPLMLLGASFPIIGAIYRKGFSHRGEDVGSLYAINTAGAIIGTVAASFWLLPAFGTISHNLKWLFMSDQKHSLEERLKANRIDRKVVGNCCRYIG